jgi:hypothetical protein
MQFYAIASAEILHYCDIKVKRFLEQIGHFNTTQKYFFKISKAIDEYKNQSKKGGLKMENITDQDLYMLNSFEEYVAKGGDILSFADYYNASHYHVEFEPMKEAIILTLCEEYAIIGNFVKIFQLLDTAFSSDDWTAKGFNYFMFCIRESELLCSLYKGIKILFQKYHPALK